MIDCTLSSPLSKHFKPQTNLLSLFSCNFDALCDDAQTLEFITLSSHHNTNDFQFPLLQNPAFYKGPDSKYFRLWVTYISIEDSCLFTFNTLKWKK